MHYCTICGQSFHQNIDDLTAHSINVHGVQPITALVWPKIDPVVAPSIKMAPPKAAVAAPSKKVARKKSTATAVPNPVAVPNSVKYHPCSICKKRFSNPSNMKMHKIRVHSNRIKIPLAPQTPANAKVVRPKTEAGPNGRMHVCPVCDKGFSLESSLKMHMRYHNRKPVSPAVASNTHQPNWQCEVCAKSFTIESLYQEHSRMHLTKPEPEDSLQSPTSPAKIISKAQITMPQLPKQITVRRSTMPSAQNVVNLQVDNASLLMPPPPRSATPIPELLVPMKYSEVLKYHPPITSRPKPLPRTMDDTNVPRLQVKKLVDLQDPNENRRRNSIDSTSQMHAPSRPYPHQNRTTFVIEHRDRDGENISNGYIDSEQSQQEILQMPPPQAYPPMHRSYHQTAVHEHQYYDPLPSYINCTVHMPNTTIPMHEHDHGYYATNFYSN